MQMNFLWEGRESSPFSIKSSYPQIFQTHVKFVFKFVFATEMDINTLLAYVSWEGLFKEYVYIMWYYDSVK